MTLSHEQHRRQSPASIRCAVVTVSDTRTPETDTGGDAVAAHLTGAGHVVVRRTIIPDDSARLRTLLLDLVSHTDLDAILLTGGTGISSRDQTYETVTALLGKPLPGYGELFRLLSYEQVGAAAMLSRAVAGVCANKVLLTMPGSPAGVQLAMERLIVPELAHLVREAQR